MLCNSNFEKELNNHLNEGIYLSNNIYNNISSQESQIENIDNSLDNITFYNKKAKKIIKRMGSFFYRIFNKMDQDDINNCINQNNTQNNIQNNIQDNIPNNDITENLISFKINCIKKNAIKIGNSIDKQNNMLDIVDLKIFNNESKMNKNITQVKNLL